MCKQRVERTVSDTYDWAVSLLQETTVDPELHLVIQRYLQEKLSQRLYYFSLIFGTKLALLRLLTAVGLLAMDEHLAFRFKVLPFICLAMYTMSIRMQQVQTLKSVVLAVAYPLTMVMLVEIVVQAQPFASLMGFGALNQTLNFILKFSNTSKHEKLAMSGFFCVYAYVRLVVIPSGSFQPSPMDIMPMIGFLVSHYFTFDLEAEINRLLNTRFNTTKKMWLHSLECMPVGVVIYNTKQHKVVFENRQVEDVLGSRELEDKYKCKLKRYARGDNSRFTSLKKIMERAIRES